VSILTPIPVLYILVEKIAKEPEAMSAEIFNTAILSITLTMVGLGLGFLFLKIQGKAE